MSCVFLTLEKLRVQYFEVCLSKIENQFCRIGYLIEHDFSSCRSIEVIKRAISAKVIGFK